MPRERVAALEDLIKTNPYWDKPDPPELQLRHDLMRAKLAGFLERPDTVARRYPSTDTSLPARYARAISAYRHQQPVGRDRADRRADREPAEQSLLPRTEGPGAARRRAGPAEAIGAAAPRGRTRAERGADPHHARPGADRDRREPPFRRGDLAAARRHAARAGGAGGLFAARHGLRPQGRSRRGRPRFRAGRARPRRHQDGARTCGARKNPFPDRFARLGQGRRHRRAEGSQVRDVRHQVHHRPRSEGTGTTGPTQ